ncbi:MAG: hypothetical protein QF866_04345 [Arenicellales bacterium]|jgi:hypothetical protein|nr:hypothetical protein [Arenicellales bacterium]
MSPKIKNGSRKDINGRPHIYYDGYWIRYYAPPPETLSAKRDLLIMLTRRTFHHTEPGINTPGNKVADARSAYQAETDPACKRVNAAMLAGALFNRATDIFTSIVNLESKGISVTHDNELMRECSACFEEALELGKQVRHPSGHEGIDELWGEPFKVFTRSIAGYYESRYVKIAQTMGAIDNISGRIIEVFSSMPAFHGIGATVLSFARAGRIECEMMKSDPDFFLNWPEFVTLKEQIREFEPVPPTGLSALAGAQLQRGCRLLYDGADLISYMAGVRVPMPKSTREYLRALDDFEVECLGVGLKSVSA